MESAVGSTALQGGVINTAEPIDIQIKSDVMTELIQFTVDVSQKLLRGEMRKLDKNEKQTRTHRT